MQPVNADLSGRTCLVTGANTGIGKEIARALARMGATVILGCRNEQKGEAARAELAAETGNSRLSVMKVDLSSLASVREFASRVLAAHPKLDVLVNNAGLWTTKRELSADGIELQWATNVLGPHLLTQLLLPALEASGHGRIINLASTAAGGLDLDDVEISRKKYSGVSAYSTTKQANRMLTWALASRLRGKPVTVNAISPGLVNTELNRNAQGVFAVVFTLTKLFARTPQQGADTAIWLAASPQVEGLTDRFWVDRKEQDCKFRDMAACEKLWNICEAQVQRVPLRASA
jgi:NAD(P)-dependent dehydrogenase (short-subunit alcohol dehydrogenase family)